MAKISWWTGKRARGKGQAFLYWNRKRRRERIAAAAVPDGALTTDGGVVLTTDSGVILTED